MSKTRLFIKKLIPEKLFDKIAPTGHLAEAVFYQTINGFPANDIKIIGVTGTDGKTSTSTMIAHILKSAGKKTALLGTIDFDLGEGPEENNSRLTTTGSKTLLSLIKRAKNNGCEYLVLETTSHALAEHRVWGIPYHIVAMTNVGHEHLDYHKTFENYRNAKLKLFKLANKNNKGLKIGLVNKDDPSADIFSNAIETPVTYGKNADIAPKNLKIKPSGSSYEIHFKIKGSGHKIKVKLNLPGEFNVYNSMAAIGVCAGLGLSDEQIEKGISSLKLVKGRMHKVDEGQDFDVVIDYAHTPDSFEKIFKTFKPITKGRIITVFGSAGRRDEKKRYTQGEVAGKYADIVIATEEDDRDQNGIKILNQIAEGAERCGKVKNRNLFLIHKREDAVQEAIRMAKKNDLVLLLGKGHEQSILTNKPGFKLKPGEVFDEEAHTLKLNYDEESVARVAIKSRLHNKTKNK
jgi:UDP-N-acetylmuramoyl-L-alanyl-D-glutamate--2,6-diaminopimelate ligase